MTTDTAVTPPSPASTPVQWRAAAASDADRVATRAGDYVDALRRSAVRDSLDTLTDPGLDCFPRAAVREHVTRVLADSVEKQARLSGLGRVTIETGVPA